MRTAFFFLHFLFGSLCHSCVLPAVMRSGTDNVMLARSTKGRKNRSIFFSIFLFLLNFIMNKNREKCGITRMPIKCFNRINLASAERRREIWEWPGYGMLPKGGGVTDVILSAKHRRPLWEGGQKWPQMSREPAGAWGEKPQRMDHAGVIREAES